MMRCGGVGIVDSEDADVGGDRTGGDACGGGTLDWGTMVARAPRRDFPRNVLFADVRGSSHLSRNHFSSPRYEYPRQISFARHLLVQVWIGLAIRFQPVI